MDKTNLKSLKDVGLDLLDLSTKLVQVAETLDAIVASELMAAKEEPKKPTKKSTVKPAAKAKKVVVEKAPIAKKAVKKEVAEEKPKAKRGRPAKAK